MKLEVGDMKTHPKTGHIIERRPNGWWLVIRECGTVRCDTLEAALTYWRHSCS